MPSGARKPGEGGLSASLGVTEAPPQPDPLPARGERELAELAARLFFN
jgi:hypothetical protein